MELEDNYSLLQDNTITILKNYPRFLTLLKVIANRLDSLQDCANYMCENTKLDKAEGIWLDYLAWLVGTTRVTYDILQYFCVNAPHLNVEKLFYFEGISSIETGTLQDSYLRKKIKAKVAYNTSKATRNENIKIIQGMVNADKVVISKPKIFDNFTTVGSPTITDDGIASGFSSSDYLTGSFAAITPSEEYIVKLKIKLNSTPVNANRLWTLQNNDACFIALYSEDIACRLVGNANLIKVNKNTDINWDINQDIYITMKVTTLKTYLTVECNGNSITKEADTNSGFISMNAFYLGGIYGYFTSGSIDLKAFSITVDGKTVYRPYREVPMVLDITLYGEHLSYPSPQALRTSIESVLGNGVGVRNLTII